MPDTGRGPQDRKTIGGELVIPIAGLLFTLYYFSTILHSPWEAQVAAFFVGVILIALVLVLLARTALTFARGEARLGFSPLLRPFDLGLKRLGLLGLTLGYIALLPYLGFTITSFLFLTCAILLLARPRRPVLIMGISAVIALAGYALFILAFNVRFPRGAFEEMMRSVF